MEGLATLSNNDTLHNNGVDNDNISHHRSLPTTPTTKQITTIVTNRIQLSQYPPPKRPKDLSRVSAVVDSAVLSYKSSSLSTPNPSTDVAYNAVLTQLRRGKDPSMLWRLLLSLGGGRSLSAVAGNAKRHENLVHLVFKVDCFGTGEAERGEEGRGEEIEGKGGGEVMVIARKAKHPV